MVMRSRRPGTPGSCAMMSGSCGSSETLYYHIRMLEKLGIAPEWTSIFELADGRQAEYGLTEVRIKIDEAERTTICIFGEPDSEPLLGAYTLEGFGLAADPVNGLLVPARLYLV